VDGVTIIDESLLIPFKARAFLDLSARLESGEKVDSKNIKKHRNDVFRLVQLLSEGVAIEVSAPIRDDLRRFVEEAQADGTLDPKAFDVPFTRDEAVEILRAAYALT
jgi:hypothetical protein